MNYKKLAAIIHSTKCKAVYEIINGWLYLMTPHAGFIICNTFELPKALDGLVMKEDVVGATKGRLLALGKKDWQPAMATPMSYRIKDKKCSILQAQNQSGAIYPIFIDEDLLSLGPKSPELILSAGKYDVVMMLGDNNTFFYMPLMPSQNVMCDILTTAQTICLNLNPQQAGAPAAYVKLDDVQRMHGDLAREGPPRDFNSEDAWDRAFFSAGEKLRELPRKVF